MTSSGEATGGTFGRLRTPAGAAFLSFGVTLFGQAADPAAAAAQVVRGEIRDAETQQPVPSAHVVVRNQADSVLSEVTAGTSGEFTMLGLPTGPLVLEVSALGYAASAETPIDHQGRSLFLAIELTPNPLEADGIRVSVEAQSPFLRSHGYYHRRKIGHGRFVSPEQLERVHATRSSDYFRRVTGVVVTNDEPQVARGPTSFSRSCRAAVYQDGQKLRDPLDASAFNDVVAPPEWIEAIEVYSGPATAPAAWRGDAGCGLIVIWTRR